MSDRKTVLHLVDGWGPDGAARRARQLVSAMRESGRYEVRVVRLERRREAGEGGEDRGADAVVRAPGDGRSPSAVVEVARFARSLRRDRVALLHTHGPGANLFGAAAAALARTTPRIAEGLEGARRRADVMALRLASAVVAMAGDGRHRLEAAGVPEDRVHVIPDGVDTSVPVPPVGFVREAALRRLGLPERPRLRFVTMLAGLERPDEDVPTLIRVACRLAFAEPDVAFVVAGDGPLREPLARAAADLGLGGRMFFVGACDRAPELLAVSSVGVLTSRAGGFPHAALEYMAGRLPVVAADAGGAREAVEEGVTGYLVNAGDDGMFAERIARLLRDGYRARLMGAHARRAVLERFSIDVRLGRVHSLYAELLGERYEAPAPLARRTAA